MQKREGFRIEVRVQPQGKGWTPQPRECATLTSHGHSMFMIGGMGHEAIKDIVEAKVMGDAVYWERTDYRSQEVILGR